MKEKNLKKIANRCSSYNNKYDNGTFTSSVAPANKSCSSCTHFTKNQKCELDLADEIKRNMK